MDQKKERGFNQRSMGQVKRICEVYKRIQPFELFWEMIECHGSTPLTMTGMIMSKAA